MLDGVCKPCFQAFVRTPCSVNAIISIGITVRRTWLTGLNLWRKYQPRKNDKKWGQSKSHGRMLVDMTMYRVDFLHEAMMLSCLLMVGINRNSWVVMLMIFDPEHFVVV